MTYKVKSFLDCRGNQGAVSVRMEEKNGSSLPMDNWKALFAIEPVSLTK